MKQDRQRKSKLDALIGREDSVRAALEEIRLRRRTQEKDDRERLGSLIGEALLLADAAETDPARREARRAFITEGLDKYTRGPSRAFVILRKWLA
jgi:hypothetical protein